MTSTNATIARAAPQDEQPVVSTAPPAQMQPRVGTRILNKVRSGFRFTRLERWAWRLAIAIIVPGGLILALLWWLARRRSGSPV